MIDTHAHLTDHKYDYDRRTVIERAQAAGVSCILTIASDISDSMNAAQLHTEFPLIKATCGIHPHEAAQCDIQSIDWRNLITDETIAIGEIGLDYHYMLSPRDIQLNSFQQQMYIANAYQKPCVIHCREAFDDLFELLNQIRLSKAGVIHSFTGTELQAKLLIKQGFFISFNGMITFKNSRIIRSVFQSLPPDIVLLETDCPYLAPEPLRGNRNEPALIVNVYQQAATLWSLSMNDVVRINRTNTKRLFDIGPGYISNSIVYEIKNSLYINLTNRCMNRCEYCVSRQSYFYLGHHLKLNQEPSALEVLQQIPVPEKYDEIVFCGLGEPLLRWEIVIEICNQLRSKAKSIRINTSGHLFPDTSLMRLVQSLTNVVDCIEVSLGNPNPESYAHICHPQSCDPTAAYTSVHEFITAVRQSRGIKLVLSCVDHPLTDIEGCRKIAQKYGVPLKERTFRDLPANEWTE